MAQLYSAECVKARCVTSLQRKSCGGYLSPNWPRDGLKDFSFQLWFDLAEKYLGEENLCHGTFRCTRWLV